MRNRIPITFVLALLLAASLALTGCGKKEPTAAGNGTGQNHSPNTPTNPVPADGATNQSIDVILSWQGGDPDQGDTVEYSVYFGTSSPPALVASGVTSSLYDPGTLSYTTMYYWKIEAKDNHDATASGPVWSFTTTTHPNRPPNTPGSPWSSFARLYPLQTYHFFAVAPPDSDGDNVAINFDWDDGTSSLSNFVSQGDTVDLNHSYSNPPGDTGRVFSVRVQAKDTKEAWSGWSGPLKVGVARDSVSNYSGLHLEGGQYYYFKHWLSVQDESYYSMKVTSGTAVHTYYFNSNQYDEFEGGGSPSYYHHESNVLSDSFAFTAPQTDYYYVVIQKTLFFCDFDLMLRTFRWPQSVSLTGEPQQTPPPVPEGALRNFFSRAEPPVVRPKRRDLEGSLQKP